MFVLETGWANNMQDLCLRGNPDLIAQRKELRRGNQLLSSPVVIACATVAGSEAVNSH
jgi:hypothetical protein